MYRVVLTSEQMEELQRRTHDKGIHPSTRDRLEMLRLSHIGWSIPRIAKHLNQHEQTVRRWVRSFLEAGFDALSNKPHLGKQSALTPEILGAVRDEIAKGERTWNAPQVTQWVAEQYGVRISHHRMRIHLRAMGLSYQRSSYTLRHKQKTEEVETKKASLESLEKGGTAA